VESRNLSHNTINKHKQKNTHFPNKKYKIIYADPPWDYYSAWKRKNSDSAGIWGLAQDHYNTMPLNEIKELAVKNICDDDCFLFLWATFPQIQSALDVIKAWGFEYKTAAFVWVKKNKSGKNFMGMGWYTRANAEICLIGKRGSPKIMNHGIKQTIESTLREHSKKPDEVRKRIVQLCGDVPRIELFARERTAGWDAWGNEV